MADTPLTCPHCGSCLKKWLVTEVASWSEEFFFVCFSNACPYYQKGWLWMKEQYNQTSSYRYMVNPKTGASSPLPVWSDSAIREMIAEDEEGEGS
jgi:hypothetical protein